MSNLDFGKIEVLNSMLQKSDDAANLVRELGKMLDMAQGFFGPRESWRSIEGIMFWRNDPEIFFPKGYSSRKIIIRLGSTTYFNAACYELAHETVHLLAPIRLGAGTNLEEGVACYFATYYMKERFCQDWRIKEPGSDANSRDRERYCAYRRALDSVSPHLDRNRSGLLKLRTPWRRFCDIKAEQLRGAFPDLNLSDAEFLASPFRRN